MWAVMSVMSSSTRCGPKGYCSVEMGGHRRGRRGAAGESAHGGSRPAVAEEGAVERLLLAFEELASNALRHGRQPIRVEVTADAGFWLLDVSDAAVDQPPTPAVGRDAAYGGMGLYLVASICTAHGWLIDRGRKHAWGCIDYTRVEARDPQLRSMPGPC